MAFELPDLPYPKDALGPHMSAETLEYHHDKHHAAYVSKTNDLIKGTEFESSTLEDIIAKADGVLFNQAAQVWNHTFFWSSLSPDGGGQPSGDVAARLDADFGSYDDFRSALTAAATSQFGSGWAWLVEKDGKLDVMKTSNADTPLAQGIKALWTIDVWEHAYYIDYRNARPKFVDAVLDNLINWEFVAQNLAS